MALYKYDKVSEVAQSQSTSTGGGGGSVGGNYLPASKTEDGYQVSEDTQFVKQLSLVTEDGTKVATIGIDANGRFYFDKGIISAEDVVAYGASGEHVATVEDIARLVLNSDIEANPSGEAEVDLTSLRIGDIVYHVEGSGGGDGWSWGGVTGSGDVIANIFFNATTKVLMGQRSVKAMQVSGGLYSGDDLDWYHGWYMPSGVMSIPSDSSASVLNLPPDLLGQRHNLLFLLLDEYGTNTCTTQVIINADEKVRNIYIRSYTKSWTQWATIPSSDVVNSLVANVESQLGNYLPKSGGTMTGDIVMPASDSNNIRPAANNYGTIGTQDRKFYRMYATNFYGSSFGGYSGTTAAFTGTFTGPLTGTATHATEAAHAAKATQADSATNAGYATTANSANSCTGNSASATKLQTSRSLWGKSFNGTADVTGDMTVNGAVNSVTSIQLKSPDGTKTATITLGNDGIIRFSNTAQSAGDFQAYKA